MGRSRHVYWLCVFSTLIIGFDLFCWQRVAAQIAAKNYRTAPGQVMRVQILNPPAGTFGDIRPEVSFGYTYLVNGRGYTGNIYRYVEPTPSPLVSLPHGKRVSVFYNPNDPADAVLARELTAEDFGKMLQLVMLNLMGFSLLGLWARWRVRTVFPAHQLWQG